MAFVKCTGQVLRAVNRIIINGNLRVRWFFIVSRVFSRDSVFDVVFPVKLLRLRTCSVVLCMDDYVYVFRSTRAVRPRRGGEGELIIFFFAFAGFWGIYRSTIASTFLEVNICFLKFQDEVKGVESKENSRYKRDKEAFLPVR